MNICTNNRDYFKENYTYFGIQRLKDSFKFQKVLTKLEMLGITLENGYQEELKADLKCLLNVLNIRLDKVLDYIGEGYNRTTAPLYGEFRSNLPNHATVLEVNNARRALARSLSEVDGGILSDVEALKKEYTLTIWCEITTKVKELVVVYSNLNI